MKLLLGWQVLQSSIPHSRGWVLGQLIILLRTLWLYVLVYMALETICLFRNPLIIYRSKRTRSSSFPGCGFHLHRHSIPCSRPALCVVLPELGLWQEVACSGQFLSALWRVCSVSSAYLFPLAAGKGMSQDCIHLPFIDRDMVYGPKSVSTSPHAKWGYVCNETRRLKWFSSVGLKSSSMYTL